MYTIENLNKLEKKLDSIRKDNLDFHCHLFDDLFIIKNKNITFQSLDIKNYNSFNFKLQFKHKKLNSNYVIKVQLSLKNFLDKYADKKINPEMEALFYKKGRLIDKVDVMKLTLKQKKYFGELLTEVSNIFINIDIDKLTKILNLYNEKQKNKNKIFRKYISYRYDYKLQENRKKYSKHFSLITKEREEKEFFNKKEFSFCYLSYIDKPEPTGFEIRQMNISIEDDKIFNNNTNVSLHSVLRHFLEDCIFFKNHFISSIEKCIELFNINDNYVTKDKNIFVPEENFEEVFKKVIIKEKVETF